jgi:sugar phosphate isomerase/epimerase
MLNVVSTHVFLRQRLHPGLLDLLARAGANGIEIFAARQHFDYTSRPHIQELADWFRSNPVQAFSMHAPIFPDMEMGRGGAPAVNVIHPEKSRRIDSMDEIKRALEAAEHLPFQYLILHLGEREDRWSPRTLEHALTALEHLQAFARPLGVKLLVENLQSDATQPANLIELLTVGHLTDINICLDTGHANLGEGVPSVLRTLKDRIRSTHIHDNKGDRDAHLWPGDGTIDWGYTMSELKKAPGDPAAVLEIHYALEETNDGIAAKIKKTFERLELA